MTSISIAALKGKTIREILELIHQAESLPENHGPLSDEGKEKALKLSPGDTKNQTAQEIIDELEGGVKK